MTSDTTKIMKEVEYLYSDLYKLVESDPPESLVKFFLENQQIPRLSFQEALLCEGKLTISECWKSLQSFQKKINLLGMMA